MAILDDRDTGSEDDEHGAGRMSLVDHLTELRHRLVVSLLAVAVGSIIAFSLYEVILEFLVKPYCDLPPERRLGSANGQCGLIITDPFEGFATRLKVGGYGGLFLASPVVLWQLWRFVTPGLYPHEKRYAIPFVLSSVVLFTTGGALALYTFPRALDFLVNIGGPNITTAFSPSKYLSFLLRVMAGFGIGFLFPVLLVFLELARVVTSKRLLGWWRQALVIIVAVAAIITPSQDPYTLLFLSVPLGVFYFGAIVIGRLLGR